MLSFLRWFRKYDSEAVSDVGLARQDNQDAVCVDSSKHVFCVADGMGGGAAGGLASRILCEEVNRYKFDWQSLAAAAGVVDAAVRRANARIRQIAAEKGYSTMGTTMAILLFNPNDPSQVAIGHVGDSRVYRRRSAKLQAMTRDHRKSAFSHLLTRAVGAADEVEVEWTQASVWKGDCWLVCTDGVHDMLPDSTINGILSRGGSASSIAKRISDAVRRAGARDNFTFCVVRT